jgi:hypothetical protein
MIATYNCHVAQITIYLPEGTAREVRRQARRAKKSVSAYLVSLALQKPQGRKWPKSFLATHGSWAGRFPPIHDPPPEPAPKW